MRRIRATATATAATAPRRIAVLLLTGLALSAAASPPPQPTPRIVNGVVSDAWPGVGALISVDRDLTLCTVTMIGCQTALTAAHCVCSGNGGNPTCPDGTTLSNPGDLNVFLPQAGIFAITDITVPPNYEFAVAGDVALLHLASPVNGIVPGRINTSASPAVGTRATIVGYGATDTAQAGDAGLKRSGRVTTASCAGAVPRAEHVCWEYEAPLGPPGTDSNTCIGDSGGPLFVSDSGGNVIAGVTSGGFSADCQAPDLSYDADVFVNRGWIALNGGADITAERCGVLPQVGEAGVTSTFINDTLTTRASYTVQVSPGATVLRVGLSGEESKPLNNFNLFLRYGTVATDSNFDCASRRDGAYEFCEVALPQAGTWHILVANADGNGGTFQLSATSFDGPIEIRSIPAWPAVPAGLAALAVLALGRRRLRQ